MPHKKYALGSIALLALIVTTPSMAKIQTASATDVMSDKTKEATSQSAPVVSVSPVTLSSPGRGDDLQVRVSAPATGRRLPIIIFSHGYGNSMDGYAPLVNFWAAHGFVVIQPTHLDSRRLALPATDPRGQSIWQWRVKDLKSILDNLGGIEAAVPGLKGRIDRTRIAAAGHSYGGITTGMLLGSRVISPDGKIGPDMSDPRIKVGVLLSTAGRGGADLTPFAVRNFPFMNPDFSKMAVPTLVIAGDQDISPLTVRGADWFADPYRLSPGGKCLVTLFGAKHLLGGISGYEVTETSDENPQRVAAVQRLTLAYLRSAFYPNNHAWASAQAELKEAPKPQGKVECD
jgi:pimeloyl-ACP methyl ester carboxylesterase